MTSQNGVGKTNLARTIGVALTGRANNRYHLNGLHHFNKGYLDECERDAVPPKWEVEVDGVQHDKAFTAVCRGMMSRGELIFTRRTPV